MRGVGNDAAEPYCRSRLATRQMQALQAVHGRGLAELHSICGGAVRSNNACFYVKNQRSIRPGTGVAER